MNNSKFTGVFAVETIMIKLLFILNVCYLISNAIIVSGDQNCEDLMRSTFKLSSNSSIKECEIVTINVDDFDKRRFRLSILSNDSVIESLYFNKTDSLLADSQTPIYLMNLQSLKKMLGVEINEDYRFMKTTIKEYVPEVGEFRFYHNYQKIASMCVFFYKSGIQLEGNIGHYVLRYLPSEDNSVQNKYVYAKLMIPGLQIRYSPWNDSFSNLSLQFNLNSPKLLVVNCKLFVILHPSSISDKPPSEVMRTLLMFYNHLDMFFGNFTSPKIRLTLKGILLPDIGKPILYEGNKQLDLQLRNWSDIDNTLMTFVKEKKDYFQLDTHDKIYFLSQSCFGEAHVGFREPDGEICRNPSTPRIAAVVHGDFQTYHILHLNYLAKSFGGIDVRNRSCPGILKFNSKWVHPVPLVWSSCTIKRFSSYFSDNDCSWFRKNKPSLSMEISDPKDDRFRSAINSDVQTRSLLYEMDEESQVGISINVTYGRDSKTLVCSCVS